MKTIGIEAFLTWAYRDELPKAEAGNAAIMGSGDGGAFVGGWDAVSRQGELMAEMVSDGRVNAYGVLPIAIDAGPPHPDAIVLHQAVSALDRWEVGLPDDWNPLVDMNLSERDWRDAVARAMPRIVMPGRDGRPRFRQRPAELVRHHAIMKSAPQWQAKAPVASIVLGPNGKPEWFRTVEIVEGLSRFTREVSGFNPRTRKPWPDAYKKQLLNPDPALAAIDRAEYEVWSAALYELCLSLQAGGELRDHVVVKGGRPARPWEAC